MTMGLMQDGPLLISTLIEHASKFHKDAEIVSHAPARVRFTVALYGDISRRSKQVANAPAELGVKPGDRVATLAWNGYRHMELYYGVSAPARCCIRSTRAFSPSRSNTSPITPRTGSSSI